jgi:plasmid stabilization system protein ParE
MAEVRLSRRASADLDAIRVWSLDHFGAARTRRYLDELAEALILLERHPEIGAPHEHTVHPFRVLPTGKHRLFYLFVNDVVTVERVLHAAQDVEGKL